MSEIEEVLYNKLVLLEDRVELTDAKIAELESYLDAYPMVIEVELDDEMMSTMGH